MSRVHKFRAVDRFDRCTQHGPSDANTHGPTQPDAQIRLGSVSGRDPGGADDGGNTGRAKEAH